MKRSKLIQLVLIGTSLVSISACDEKKSDSNNFASKEECEKVYDGGTCEKMAEKSLEEHVKTAPKYQSKEECEKIHGEGKCVTPPGQTGTHSMFMPMMMGYALGRMMGGSPVPMPPQRDDGRRSSHGGSYYRSSPSQSPNPAANQPSVQRGGFGATGRAFSSSSGS